MYMPLSRLTITAYQSVEASGDPRMRCQGRGALLVPDSDWAGDMAGEIVPGGTPENPLKARWMGIYDGAGIHGTDDEDSLGSSASHGCIRMAVPEVKELYERVEIQTPVFIA